MRAADSRWKICPRHLGAIQAGPYAAVALLDLHRKRRANPRNDAKSLLFNARHQLPGRKYNVNVGNTQVCIPVRGFWAAGVCSGRIVLLTADFFARREDFQTGRR